MADSKILQRLVRAGLIPGRKPRYIDYRRPRCPHCGGELPADEAKNN